MLQPIIDSEGFDSKESNMLFQQRMLEQGIDVSKLKENEENKYTFDLLKAFIFHNELEQ